MELNNLKKQFGNQAEIYSKYRQPYPAELYAFFFSLLPVGEKTILDIACGPGNSTRSLVKEDTKVFGCDIDPMMIEQAKKEAKENNLDIQYVVAEAEHLPYADGTFDAITVGTAFHWFVNQTALTEIKRVLKPSGLFFAFWTMNKNDIRVEDDQVLQVFRSYNWPRVPQELRDLTYISDFLKQQGLQKVSVANIPIAHTETLEERVNLEKTNAGYNLLAEGDREKFVDSLRAVLKASLGSKESFLIQEELQISYGFKA
jgi:ubiquinone/menaquinone biosynthesis C-methylase UbiE